MGLTLETLFHEISARKDQIYKVTLSYLEVCRGGQSECNASMQNCFSLASSFSICLLGRSAISLFLSLSHLSLSLSFSLSLSRISLSHLSLSLSLSLGIQ